MLKITKKDGKYFRELFLMLLIGIGCLSTTNAISEELKLCDILERFSKDLVVGEKRSLKLSIESNQNSQLQKVCKPWPMDDRGLEACNWLSRNTSNEFMAQNISHAAACLAGAVNLVGKNVLVDKMSGMFTVFDPFNESPKTRVVFEYYYKDQIESGENFYILTVTRSKD